LSQEKQENECTQWSNGGMEICGFQDRKVRTGEGGEKFPLKKKKTPEDEEQVSRLKLTIIG